jgi:glycopeptide antibiotics resistance protein
MKTRSLPAELQLLLLWGFFVLYGTTIPFDLTLDPNFGMQWRHAHKIPWRNPDGGWPSLPDVVSNVLLFIPGGFLLALRRVNAGKGFCTTAAATGLGSLLVSLAVETLQLFSESRVTSTTDLVTNTTGGLLGGVLGWFVAARTRLAAGPWLLAQVRQRPLAALAAVASSLTIVCAVAPFDLSLDVDDVKSSIKHAHFLPFAPILAGEGTPWDPAKRIVELLTWALLAGTIAAAFRRESLPRHSPWALAACGTVTLAAGCEVLQLLVKSRTTDAGTVLVAATAALLGIGAGKALRYDRARLATIAIGAWAAATLLAGLDPWRFAAPSFALADFERWLPFIHHFRRTNFNALADVLLQCIQYAPLGALLVLRRPSTRTVPAALSGFAIGLAVEILQGLLPSRTPDTTDAIFAAAGSYLGARALRWGWRQQVKDTAAKAEVAAEGASRIEIESLVAFER